MRNSGYRHYLTITPPGDGIYDLLLANTFATINRVHVQGTWPRLPSAMSSVEASPHKQFGLELTAERFTPPDKLGICDMPGVHKKIQATGRNAAALTGKVFART